nr:hypothetical protein [Tanacetum cinerariifolium]
MKGYKLPPSYYAIKKTFKTIRLGYEAIHACVNDCFLFRGDNNKDVHFCLVCKTSRWKDSNTSGKNVTKKVLRYFLIIPRLQHLYKSSQMTWHATGKYTEPGKLQHPVDGKAWKNFDTNQAYSMWPVILTTYNLPSWLCMKESSFMLTLLIPGAKTLGKDIDTINDFPARSSLSGWSGQDYKACRTCNKDTPFVRVLGKTSYVGHRRFLKKPHKLRRSLEFNGEIKDGDPPRKFDQDQINARLTRLPTCVKGKHPSYRGVKIKRNVLVELNWTKRSIFYELEYCLNDLDNATLHIDGQSTEVDAPPDIIDLDEDDDIIDDEDAFPHDLTDSDDEDLVNVDDDDGVDMLADLARGHGGDGGGDDFPPTHHIPTGCEGCFANRGKGTRKSNLGGRKSGRLHTRQEIQNLGLKKITDDKGLSRSGGDAVVLPFLAKALDRYQCRHPAAPAKVIQYQQGFPQGSTLCYKPEDRDVRRGEHQERSPSRSKLPKPGKELGRMPVEIPVTCSPSRSDAGIRGQRHVGSVSEMESSVTPEYPLLIHTFFVTHTVNGVFRRDEDRVIYALSSNTPSRKGKQRGHLPDVGRVLPGRATDVLIPPLRPRLNARTTPAMSKAQKEEQYVSTPDFGNASESGECGDDEMASDEDVGEEEEDEEDGDS